MSTGARQQLADTIATLAAEAKVQAGSKLTGKAATKKQRAGRDNPSPPALAR